MQKGNFSDSFGGFTSKIVSPRAGDRRCVTSPDPHTPAVNNSYPAPAGWFFFSRKHRGFTAAWKRLTRARCKHFHAPSDVEATPARAAAAAAQPHPLWLLRVLSHLGVKAAEGSILDPAAGVEERGVWEMQICD